MRKLVFFSLGFSLSAFAYTDCRPSVSLEQASQMAKQYVGEVYSVNLRQSKKTGECYYTVRGKEGTATIDASSGKLVRFYRSR